MYPIRPAAAFLAAFTAALGGCSSGAGDAPATVHSAVVTPFPPDESFSPFQCDGEAAGDVVGDAVTGGSFRDIVGNAQKPAFYRAATTDDVFFRMRVSGDPRKPGSNVLQPSSYDVLVDADGVTSTYEFMLTADGNFDSGTKVQWVRNSVKEPGNPMDPANDAPGDVLADFVPASDYWMVTEAMDGSSFGGNADYFITLRIPKATLRRPTAEGGAGLDLTRSFAVWGGTNAQNYSLNADYGCVVGMNFNLGDVATDPGPLDPVHIPDAIPDEASTDEDVPVTTSVLGNDTGLADGPIVVTVASPPAHGTATVEPDGRVTYTPAPNWNGTDAYSYEVTDAGGENDTATVTVTVAPVNDAPVATADLATGYAGVDAIGIAVLANDVDVDGDALSVSAVTQGTNGGTVTIRPDGTVAYVPPTPQFQGTDSFTYAVSDGALSDSAPVTVTVGPPLDSDEDGLPDWVEDDDGDDTVDPGETDPHDADTDDDGLLDGIEDANHNGQVDPGETDPLDPDSDDDGLLDGIEDANHNGHVDPGETNPLDPDSDDDGLLDGIEDANHNGQVDPGETNPLDPDSDDDGLLDGTEDADHDGTFDPGETNPLDPDTDGDIMRDGREDSNHDGLVDGSETDPRIPDYGVSGGGCSSGPGGGGALALAAVAGLFRAFAVRRRR